MSIMYALSLISHMDFIVPDLWTVNGRVNGTAHDILILIAYAPRPPLNRGSYMSAHVLMNLLNELRKRDFRNKFNKFNNTRARMLDSIYYMTNTLKSNFWRKTL